MSRKSKDIQEPLLYTPGLLHLNYATLYDTKQLSGEELDYGWKVDAVDRNFVGKKVSIQGKTKDDDPQLLAGATWVERRNKLASALSLDMTQPEEAQKLSAFMSAFNQAALAVAPQEIKALLGEDSRAMWQDSRFDVSYREGKFFVSVTQFWEFYKDEKHQTDALEATAIAKSQSGDQYKAPMPKRSVHYTLELDPITRTFSMVDEIAFDKAFATFIKEKKEIDPSVSLDARVEWFKSRQFSHALKNSSHDDFLKSYQSFLEKLPSSLKKKEHAEQLLKAGIESAVIEYAHQVQLSVKSDVYDLKIEFHKLLNDYLDAYIKYFPVRREAIKGEMVSAVLDLMAVYSKCYDNERMDNQAVQEAFKECDQKYKNTVYAKMLSPLASAMGDSIIAKRIELAAFPQLAGFVVSKGSVTSTDSAVSVDRSLMLHWRSAGSRIQRNIGNPITQASDDDDDDVNRRFLDFPNM